MIHENIHMKKILTEENKQSLLRVATEYRLLGYNKLSVHYKGEKNSREFDVSLFNEINNEIKNIKIKMTEEKEVDPISTKKEIKSFINAIKDFIESIHPNFYQNARKTPYFRTGM